MLDLISWEVIFQFELLFRILLAAICGGCIGYERMNHFKSAGVKTHMIVALSSALIMIVSKYGFADMEIGKFDASRVAAQVVSGIGFIGAGIIFKKNQSVQGLTTAAGILGTSGIGLAIGSGMYAVGVLGTALYIVVCTVVQSAEKFQNGIQESYSIYMDSKQSVIEVLNVCDDTKVVAYSVQNLDRHSFRLDATLIFGNKKQASEWENSLLLSDKIYKFERF